MKGMAGQVRSTLSPTAAPSMASTVQPVRSVMERTQAPPQTAAGEIEENATLESVIALSGGDTNLVYRVMQDGAQTGVLHMQDLVRALVPTAASEDGLRAGAA